MSATLSDPFAGADVIHAYARTEAIRDDMLVDVTETGREADFSIPVAPTAGSYDECVRWTAEDAAKRPNTCQNEAGRLWDVVWMAACKARLLARGGSGTTTALFDLIVFPRPGHGRRRRRTLKLSIGPGDTGEPVATILLPHED